MNTSGKGEKIGYAFYSIKEGLNIFIKNLQLVIPVLAIMVLCYFLMIFAVLVVIPSEKIQEITEKYGNNVRNSEKIGEEVLKEVSAYLNKNLTRAISIFLLFGLAIFVLQEFNSAGLAASSIELSLGRDVSISKFLEKGFIYTFRIVQLDLVAILIGTAISSPFILLLYISSHSVIFEIAFTFIFIFVILLTTFSKFYVIEDAGVFDSIAKGTRFLLKNFLSVIFIFLTWSLIALPLASLSFILPPLIFLWPALLFLLYIFMAKYYVSLRHAKESNEEPGGDRGE